MTLSRAHTSAESADVAKLLLLNERQAARDPDYHQLLHVNLYSWPMYHISDEFCESR